MLVSPGSSSRAPAVPVDSPAPGLACYQIPRWNPAASGSGSDPTNQQLSRGGTHRLTAVATDAAGNSVTSATVTVTIR